MANNLIFDKAQLLRATCDDHDLAVKVIDVFLSDIPMQLDALEKALAAGDAGTAERIAHSIKGAAATVGGERLRYVAFDCENLGRDGKLDECKNRLPEMREQFAAMRRELVVNGFAAL